MTTKTRKLVRKFYDLEANILNEYEKKLTICRKRTIILYWTIKSKGINTLFYSGFSTNMIIYESAHGIYFTKLFDNFLKILLLRNGTSSWVFSNSDFNKNYIKYLQCKHIPSLSSNDLM